MQQKDITKKQHYVPVFYLKNFLSQNSKKLYIYDKEKKRYFQAMPKNLCNKNYLYETQIDSKNFICPNEIENQFSSLEGKSATLIKKIINDYKNNKIISCNDNEKKLLSEFSLNMFLRNPKTLDILKATPSNIPNKILENEEIKSCQKDLALYTNNEIADIKPFISYVYKREYLVNYCPKCQYNSYLNELLNLHFHFVITESLPFITSDFPLYYEWTSDNSFVDFIHLPIHPHIALVFSRNKISNQILYPEPNEVKKINSNYVIWDYSDFIIARDKINLKII